MPFFQADPSLQQLRVSRRAAPLLPRRLKEHRSLQREELFSSGLQMGARPGAAHPHFVVRAVCAAPPTSGVFLCIAREEGLRNIRSLYYVVYIIRTTIYLNENADGIGNREMT